MSLHRISGGLVLAPSPRASADSAIRTCPVPSRLYLPLIEGNGQALHCRVVPGQRVRRGEALAHAADALGTILPAPASGCIVAIEDRTVAHASGLSVPTLVLDADCADDADTLPPLPGWADENALTLRRRLADAGIVGLGGAGFETAEKLARPVETLILNGAECEPYIGCDEALLRERAADVVMGAALLAHIAGAGTVILALEDRMQEAAAAVRAELHRFPALQLALVPTVYPQGGERQLIEVLCGREVPTGNWPTAIGVVVQNVATAAAAWRAVAYGEQLTTRIVSLAGRGIVTPGVFDVRIGTTTAALVDAGGGYTADAARLVLGGPLMGLALPHDEIALTRTSNAILVLAEHEVRPSAPELPCIRCGDCADACPVRLQPQELLRLLRSGDETGAGALGLADCIECGCCAYVCPSQIPLVDWYRSGKSAIATAAAERRRADHARERFLARNRRLAREQADKVARVAARRDALVQEQAAIASTRDVAAAVPATSPDVAPAELTIADTLAVAAPPMDKSAVLAAIARGRAKRAGRENAPVAGIAAADSSDPPPPREEP
jgi:Na+-translocating ferredoxin:NAD+ oxidoreductase subunit C